MILPHCHSIFGCAQPTPVTRSSQEHTTTSSGPLHKKHNISRKWRISKDFHGWVGFTAGGAFPPGLHRLSATFPEEFHSLCTRRLFAKSSGNWRVLRRFCTRFPCRISAARPLAFSSAFSCFFLVEKGRKASGIHNLRKSRFRRRTPPYLGVPGASAHRMWHVEQFTFQRFAATGRELVLPGRARSAEFAAAFHLLRRIDLRFSVR